ncbi:unnamed protein product [Bursaphelenchus okinawaensis]|uniref:Uncharacterized protein n=1 Tax=Bursaphelenchus okinawaensis TaxID=465554 RepID=A0A811KBG3_9BILA|nr:unnamed protein product [Bursaphelenchus okinawaensis]CAG9100934.1 unnamed protein product [Bursaphelenchus okinawaensis]
MIKTPLDIETDKAQSGYIKSPYAQTLVAGFNVWQFDDDEDPIVKTKEKPKVLQAITNLEDKKQDLFPCRDYSMIIGPIEAEKPMEMQQLSVQFNATSIMSRFQDAPEFVPGRSLHTSHANLDELRRLTPEPESTQNLAKPVEKSASNKSLNTTESKPSERLPAMSFDQLRIMAAEMRKQKEKSEEKEESKEEKSAEKDEEVETEKEEKEN